MRKIIYICDNCGREYPYELQATDNERGILATVLGKEYCRQCLKKAIELLSNYKLETNNQSNEISTDRKKENP